MAPTPNTSDLVPHEHGPRLDRTDASATKCVWTIQEAAEYLSVPVNSLYKMTGLKARLRVPHIRIAGRLRFRRSDLDRWLDLLSVSNLDVLAKAHRRVPRR
jgi:excisionase family DNA binding protein